ncbi:MAG: PAS domain-containing protein, partial [Bacteroidetes bacterium]|nr:PAS domain-containing protein [Bacteroidota bacterium]
MSSADEKLIETLFGDSSKLWETTFNGINDSVLLLNPEGLILLANKISYNLFQKNEGEIVGKRCYEIVHNTNCHIDGCALVKMKLSKQREKTLLPFADKWFEVTVDPILDNENNLIAAVHIVSDVTECKKTEVALANSNKLLADSQKIGKVGGWEFNIDTLEQTWTEETCRIHEVELGYKPDVEEGIDFYLPASRPIIKRAVRNAIEKGESFDLELEIFTANKNLKWVHTIGNADLINRRVYGFFQDITDQKKIELKLKESETKFKSLYNSIPIPTYTWKIVGNEFFLLQYNDEAVSIHYSSIKERIGMTAGELYYDSSEILFDLNLCYKEQSSFQKELIYNDKSNNEYKYLYLKYAFVGPDLVIIHVENITERKKSEEALRESKNKYHGLFDTMQEFVIVVEVVNDSNGNPYDFKYLSLNKSAERLTGLTEEKVVGRTYREIEKNINEDVIITVGEVAQRRQPAIREWYSYPTKRWLMQHLYSVNSGQVVFLGIDITKRKLMEDSLK